jgi:hypothetical protein
MIDATLVSEFFVQSPDSAPPNWLTFYLLPVTGLAIIIFCLCSSNRPIHHLKFEGLGVHLEITTQTLMLLLGVAMMSAGFIFNVLDVTGGEKNALNEAMKEKARADAAERFTVRLILGLPQEKEMTPELIPVGEPNSTVDNLICRYRISSHQTQEQQTVTMGEEDTIIVEIPEVSRNDVISELFIAPKDFKKNWKGDVMKPEDQALYPLHPRVNLVVKPYRRSSAAH